MDNNSFAFLVRLLAVVLLVTSGCTEKVVPKSAAMEPIACSIVVSGTSARSDRWNRDAGTAFTKLGAADTTSTVCEQALADGGSDGTNGGSAATFNCGCPITAGGTVLMQCRQGSGNFNGQDVYFDSTNVTASQIDQYVNFGTFSDPYPIYLAPTEKQISVISADGGTGVCFFMNSLRKRPY